jgi:hypothetical protein
MQITTIGLDLAKHWFQVHGVDADGRVVVRRRLWRSGVIAYFRSLEPCLVGIEACATAHYWARELTALGHRVKLMPPVYVKAYVKRNKNDAADAEAICEAVTRPSMRFVPVKDAASKAEPQPPRYTIYRFSKGTLAETRGNVEDAPLPAVRRTAIRTNESSIRWCIAAAAAQPWMLSVQPLLRR